MGNFYNETRVRTKIFVVTHVSLLVISAIIVNIVLTTEKFIGLGITGYMTIGIPALFLMGAAFEAIRCRIRYRYLIIADQLIIHRVKGARDEVKVDIKLKDIFRHLLRLKAHHHFFFAHYYHPLVLLIFAQ